MQKGRPVEFPDPNDRSANKPHTFVERDDVLSIYNQEHPGNKARNVSESVKSWFEEEALKLEWSSVTFVDSNAVLKANVTINK